MTGFKAITRPPAPRRLTPAVIAPDGALPCGEKNPGTSALCARPCGHDGGHLSAAGKYWQAQPAQVTA